MLEEGAPLGEVVIPEEVEGVWGNKGAEPGEGTGLRGKGQRYPPLPRRAGSCGFSRCSTYSWNGTSTARTEG